MTPDYTSLGGRAQEILRVAEEQARETTHRASTAADDLVDGAAARRRPDARRHRARARGAARSTGWPSWTSSAAGREDDTRLALERAQASAQQLLAAARLEAEAVRTEAEARAHDLVQTAVLEAEQHRVGGAARGRRRRGGRRRAPREHLRRAPARPGGGRRPRRGDAGRGHAAADHHRGAPRRRDRAGRRPARRGRSPTPSTSARRRTPTPRPRSPARSSRPRPSTSAPGRSTRGAGARCARSRRCSTSVVRRSWAS